MLIAAAAMAFTSCQKEETAAPETVSATLTMHAGVEQTKTYLGENNAVLWGKGEVVKLYVGSGETAKFFDSASTDKYDGEASASFTFAIEGVAQADSYALGGIYPASASNGITNDNPKSFKFALPATQKAEPGKYDPSAYIMVLKPEAVEALPSEYTASFRRAVALNKITLTNVKEDISTVEITVPNTKYLAGRRNFDLTTGESGEVYENGGRTNTIKVNSDYSAGTIDVWFTSWGVELAEGQELTVKMISSSKIYTRTITAKEGGIKFVEGDLNKLTVNMESATVEVNSDLSGDYLIASVPKSWNLMSGTNDGKYYSHIVSGVTTSATEVKCSDFYALTGINNYIWTVAKMGDNYSIKNKTTGKYVSYTGIENEAYTSDDAVEFVLSEKDGVMTVESKDVAGRKLQYNASSPRFAFYTTGQTPLYFIPWEADTTPRIFVEKNSYEVEAAEGSIDIVYTTNDLVTGQIEASVKNGASMTINSTSVEYGKVTVNYAANTAQEPKTATIVLSYDGAEPQEVVITQAAAGATKQYYVKVTTAPTDWSGTYLMVCDSKKMVLSGISTTSTKYGIGSAVDITDNKIEATETLASYQVVLSPGSTSGSYLMKFKGSYLYWGSGNSLATNANNNSNTNWLLSVSNGNVTIKNCKDNTRVIVWNASSPRFACYTSTQTAIQLYKLEDGNAGGETPEQPETPAAPVLTIVEKPTSDIAAEGDVVTVKYSVTNPVEGKSVTASANQTWVNGFDYSVAGEVSFIVEENAGVARTATVTLAYEGATSQTVTISQAAAQSGGDDSVEPVTISKTISSIAQANSWSNEKQYKTVNLDNVITAAVTGGGNTGKYYSNGNNWRLYQSESAKLTITAIDGYTINSVKITYTNSNSGTLKSGSALINSATQYNVNASSVTYSVGNTGTATNGQVRVTAIEVVYKKN